MKPIVIEMNNFKAKHMARLKELEEYVNSLSVPFVKSILSLTTHPEFLIPVAIISLVLLIVISYKIIKIQYNKNLLKKVAFQGNEIELFEQENDSYFDKYLNEIIYLFENCGANVIVFEDMDRFNSNEIFQRLREVNILVNNKRNDNSPIRFFYLLKDDIFSSKDRTKFFDFIFNVADVFVTFGTILFVIYFIFSVPFSILYISSSL